MCGELGITYGALNVLLFIVIEPLHILLYGMAFVLLKKHKRLAKALFWTNTAFIAAELAAMIFFTVKFI